MTNTVDHSLLKKSKKEGEPFLCKQNALLGIDPIREGPDINDIGSFLWFNFVANKGSSISLNKRSQRDNINRKQYSIAFLYPSKCCLSPKNTIL